MIFIIISIVLILLLLISLSAIYQTKIFHQITYEMTNGEIDVNIVDFAIYDISRK